MQYKRGDVVRITKPNGTHSTNRVFWNSRSMDVYDGKEIVLEYTLGDNKWKHETWVFYEEWLTLVSSSREIDRASHIISKSKKMSVIKNAFMSKESKAVNELGLGENSNNLNSDGLGEMLRYIYETDKELKAGFLAKLVEVHKERKAKK